MKFPFFRFCKLKKNKQSLKIKMGLEIHLCLNTKTKLFSQALNTTKMKANSAITPYDLGYPGIPPTIQSEAVMLAIRAGNILNAKIAKILEFDRKNYFYFDLPHGYQITQIRHPLATDGMLLFPVSQKRKKVNIPFIVLEEDVAKTRYTDEGVLLDFNRHGAPLIEIVTAPEFSSFIEINSFLSTLFPLFSWASISSCAFNEGIVRVDLNISLTLNNCLSHPRTEIKNLNSVANIEKAIEEEVSMQKKSMLSKKIPLISSTKRFCEKTQKLITMRKKFTSTDYAFLAEGLLLPQIIPESWKINERAHAAVATKKYQKFLQIQKTMNPLDQKFLQQNFHLQPFFIEFKKNKLQLKTIILFFREFIIPNNPSFQWLYKNFDMLIKLLIIYELKKVTFSQVRELMNELYTRKQINIFAKIKNIFLSEEVSRKFSEQKIAEILQVLLKKKPDIKLEYRKNPTKITHFLVGKILTISQKQADPEKCQKVIRRLLAPVK